MQASGTRASLRGIHAVDGKTAWASGTQGIVLRTRDGGEQRILRADIVRPLHGTRTMPDGLRLGPAAATFPGTAKTGSHSTGETGTRWACHSRWDQTAPSEDWYLGVSYAQSRLHRRLPRQRETIR
ncbi:MAG: hypothetical protein ACYDC6_11200 [Acidobacteriaceae bacterium]